MDKPRTKKMSKPPGNPPHVRKKDYFDKAEQFYGERVKDRSIAIPDSVHKAMVRLADDLNKSNYEAYTEAARAYLEAHGKTTEIEGLGKISADEKLLALDIIQIYRRRRTEPILAGILNTIKLLIQSAKLHD